MSYGLLGEKLGHSFSKILHGQMGNEDYELIPVSKDKVGEYLSKADFDGINVTIPYKEVAMRYCIPDEISSEIGCVNTLYKKDGKIYGYNTDCLGFAYLSRQVGAVSGSLNIWKDKKVVILGSGGTSKTATYVALKCGASKVVIVSRKSIDDDTQSDVIHSTYDDHKTWSDAQILVNTTPVGMFPNNDDIPVDLDIFSNLEAVLDVIYNPLNTRLVKEALKRGIPAKNGLVMLVAQGWYSEEIWKENKNVSLNVKDEPDEDICEKIDSITDRIYKQKQNIVLTGMPGSGKSTIGKMLSQKLGCKFVDTDERFTEKFGITPGDCITINGEAKFRDMESEVVKEVSKESGIVIATGGGAVLREENRDALKSNGYIVFLNKDPKTLATEKRPLSQNGGVMKLYEERMPVYRSFKDLEIPVSDDADITFEDLMNKLF